MLATALTKLAFEPFAIDHLVDGTKRYDLELDPQFPFAIKLFSYDHVTPPYPLNWHPRFELFVPLAGEGTFVMGDRGIPFAAGDVLVIDNMRLHGLAEFRGRRRRAMVVTFSPEFIYTLGSPLCDALFLTPFYSQADITEPVVKEGERVAPSLHEPLLKLVSCYFQPSEKVSYRAGCKAYLLEALYVLTTRFGWSETSRLEYLKRHEQARQLGTLHDYLLANYSTKIPIATACSLVGMCESRFSKFFKAATGETFVAYLTRLRVERAGQLLQQTDQSVAEIASAVGFADQSHFDRMFRRYFQRTPTEVRRGLIVVPGSRARNNS